jgi:hypothetical protein
LARITNTIGRSWCAAVHSAWIEYIDEPSPDRQRIGRLRARHGHAERAGHALADAAAAPAVVVAGALEGEGLEQVEVGRDGLVDHDDVVGAPALISAMQRAIEVGVRDQAFSTRAFWAASSASFCAFSAPCAWPRRALRELRRRAPRARRRHRPARRHRRAKL